MKFITISEKLNLSLANEDYEETVQKRWDYIQEQLEKDPNWVGYDYVEYWSGKTELLLSDLGTLIGTDGKCYKFKDGVLVTRESTRNVGYPTKYCNASGTSRSLATHRIVASTFIPRPKDISHLPFYRLEVNHKDGIKNSNNILNLEWVTGSRNVQHAYETGLSKSGLEDPYTKPVLATIVMEGPYKGQQFVLAGLKDFLISGISRTAVSFSIKGRFKMVSGCTWEHVTREEFPKYYHGVPDGYIEYLSNNKALADSKVKPVLGTVLAGEHKDYKFCLFGSKDITKNGFSQSKVSISCNHGTRHRGIKWEYIQWGECNKYPHGFTPHL